MSRGRVKQILEGIWSFTGKWRLKTMESGLWGIFFERQDDKLEVLKRTPWIISNQLLNVRDWPSDGFWQGVNMSIAAFWVEIHGLPTPYLAAQNSRVIGAKVRSDGLTLRSGTNVRKGTIVPGDVGVAHSLGKDSEGNTSTMHGTVSSGKVTSGKSQKLAGTHKRNSTRFNPLEVVSNHPITQLDKHPDDDYVIISLMPNVGPTAAQMVDLPHESLCKSRTPHQHPEPIILPKPSSDKVEKLAEMLLGSSISSGLSPSAGSSWKGLSSFGLNDGPTNSKGKKRKTIGSVTPVIFSTPEAISNPPLGMVLNETLTFSEGKTENNVIASPEKKRRGRKTERSRGASPFKFYEAWFKEGSCMETINLAWNSSSIEGSQNLAKCLDAIRLALQRWNKLVVHERPSDSPGWRGILGARKLICDGSCTVIANGEDTNLWWQPWIPWMAYDEFRETMEVVRSKAPSLRCVADLMFRRSKTWNHGFLVFLFGSDLGGLISSIQINKFAEKDHLIWKNSETGFFSVKGAYLSSQRSRFDETQAASQLQGSDFLRYSDCGSQEAVFRDERYPSPPQRYAHA
ncbi:hypothetical protein G4B88_013155 [Cannabis sativa]|uniref:DUF4283 domain-containing protein n=1 Tax=Cannabis sativa TaxID=3483 RepID=A0A7J6DMZ8_CANSA|nr:hypothetical protein G4B88_013155 [Cannabis sativa]